RKKSYEFKMKNDTYMHTHTRMHACSHTHTHTHTHTYTHTHTHTQDLLCCQPGALATGQRNNHIFIVMSRVCFPLHLPSGPHRNQVSAPLTQAPLAQALLLR